MITSLALHCHCKTSSAPGASAAGAESPAAPVFRAELAWAPVSGSDRITTLTVESGSSEARTTQAPRRGTRLRLLGLGAPGEVIVCTAPVVKAQLGPTRRNWSQLPDSLAVDRLILNATRKRVSTPVGLSNWDRHMKRGFEPLEVDTSTAFHQWTLLNPPAVLCRNTTSLPLQTVGGGLSCSSCQCVPPQLVSRGLLWGFRLCAMHVPCRSAWAHSQTERCCWNRVETPTCRAGHVWLCGRLGHLQPIAILRDSVRSRRKNGWRHRRDRYGRWHCAWWQR